MAHGTLPIDDLPLGPDGALTTMSAGAELLETLIDHDEVMTRKQLAHLWGVDVRSVSYKITGQVHVSIEEWRRLFATTHDLRITDLLLGGAGFVAYEVPDSTIPADESAPEVLRRFRVVLETSSQYTDRMMQILEDLRIDDRDTDLIVQMKSEIPELFSMYLTVQSLIERLHERSMSPGQHQIGRARRR